MAWRAARGRERESALEAKARRGNAGPPDAGLGDGAGGAGPEAGDAGPSSGEGGTVVTDPGTAGDGMFTITAPFTAAPEVSDHPGVAKGKIVQFNMANSTTFADGARKVAVYVPAGYVSGTEVAFVVAQDGVNPQNGGSFGTDDLRPMMDNMIADGRLPMMAGIFVDPAGMRSVEYDTVSDKYYQFVETELLPLAINQVQTQLHLALNLTKDPEGRSTFGGSSGGAAAFTMGWFHPESYRRILTLSGSFTPLKTSMQYPNGAADYHNHLIADVPAKPLRVFLEAGSNDIGGTTPRRRRWERRSTTIATLRRRAPATRTMARDANICPTPWRGYGVDTRSKNLSSRFTRGALSGGAERGRSSPTPPAEGTQRVGKALMPQDAVRPT